jgi:hypothetical protein
VSAVLAVKKFGKYEIIRKLGRSMTDVYLALDESCGRQVVLKIVERSDDPATEALLEAERRGAAIQQQIHALDKRILEVYEFGERENCFFVAMEYCEGRSLAEILQEETRIDAERAARYAVEVSSQLNTLHSFLVEIDGRKRAIVHGDIKPSNIQIAASGEARLLDFGIAKTITFTHNLTNHNLGSPAYCSPERLKSAQVDPGADLWALGVTLYELVCGLPPYQAQTTRKLETLIQSRRPPRALPESCPTPLKAIVTKALAADPARRYPTAVALESDLRAFLQHRRTSAETERLPSWDSNATIEKRGEKKGPAARTDRRQRVIQFVHEANRTIWALAAGLIAGLMVLIPPAYLYRFWNESAPLRDGGDYTQRPAADIAADWQFYRALEKQNAFVERLLPIDWVRGPFRARLLATADAVIDGYRNSSDPVLDHFEWEKAQLALGHALELNPGGRKAQSRQALCDGYVLLVRNGPAAAANAQADFERAARLDASAPDPHLALARVEVYGLHNAGQAAAEFLEAERRGYHAGPRETQEQADAWLYRAEQELKRARQLGKTDGKARRRLRLLAERDFHRARSLYEPVSDFAGVNENLQRIDRDLDAEREWERRQAAARAHKKPVRRRGWR